MRRVLIVAVLLTGAAPAQAGVVARHVRVDRLRLAGGRVLLAHRAATRVEAIDLVTSNRAPQRMALLRSGPDDRCTGDSGGEGVDFGFDASTEAIAASSVCSGLDEQTVTLVDAGPLGQPPAVLARCSPPGVLRPAVAVTGTQVAYLQDDACTSGGQRLIVQDLGGGAPRAFAIPPGPQQFYEASEMLQAAGPFLAYNLSSEDHPAVGALDLRTGAQRTLTLSGTAGVSDVDVDAAGRLLVHREGVRECGAVELYEAGVSAARVLDPCADDAGIGLADGRAAFFSRGRLHIGDRVLATLPPRMRAAHLVFDGARAAYDVPECRGRRDVVVVRAAGPAAAPVAADCPFSVPRRRLRLAHGGVTVRIVCPRGCADPSMRLLSGGGRQIGFSTAFPAGTVQHLTLRTPAERLIRRRGRLRAILRVAVLRLDGRFHVRRVGVTIVAR